MSGLNAFWWVCAVGIGTAILTFILGMIRAFLIRRERLEDCHERMYMLYYALKKEVDELKKKINNDSTNN